MKLRDWIEFNFNNNEFSFNIGDVCVKVFRKRSYKFEDMIFSNVLDPIDMAHLFGEYTMFHVGKENKNHYTNDFYMCVYICKEGGTT